MSPLARAALVFGSATFTFHVASSIYSICILNWYEPAWGKGGTLLFLSGAALLPSLVTALGCAVGITFATVAITPRTAPTVLSAAALYGINYIFVLIATANVDYMNPVFVAFWFLIASASISSLLAKYEHRRSDA